MEGVWIGRYRIHRGGSPKGEGVLSILPRGHSMKITEEDRHTESTHLEEEIIRPPPLLMLISKIIIYFYPQLYKYFIGSTATYIIVTSVLG